MATDTDTSADSPPGTAWAPGATGTARGASRLARVRGRLELPTLRRATGLLDGRHRSVFIGHGQQAVVRFEKQPVTLGAYHIAFRQPCQRRDLAKSLGRRALNRRQEGNIVLLSQA